MTAKANGIPILGHAPPPLEGEWLIASDGRRDYLGRVVDRPQHTGAGVDMSAVDRVVQLRDALELEPAYEFISQPMMQKVDGAPAPVPNGEAVWFALPLFCSCDKPQRRVYVVRPVSIVPISQDSEIMRKRLASAVQYAEDIRGQSAERHGVKPLVAAP